MEPIRIGDVIRYTVPVWKKSTISGVRAARSIGQPGAFRRGDISYRRTVVGIVARTTASTVWVDTDDGEQVMSRRRSMRSVENLTRRLAELPVGCSIDMSTGEIIETPQAISIREREEREERAEAEVQRWIATIQTYGEAKARAIATVHLGSDGIITRVLRGEVAAEPAPVQSPGCRRCGKPTRRRLGGGGEYYQTCLACKGLYAIR